jgi:hypothetical protein
MDCFCDQETYIIGVSFFFKDYASRQRRLEYKGDIDETDSHVKRHPIHRI